MTARSVIPETPPIPPAEWRNRSGTSASSARIPPSPPWSARITKTMYFTVTTRRSAQNMSDSTPNRSVRSTMPPSGAATWRHSLSV